MHILWMVLFQNSAGRKERHSAGVSLDGTDIDILIRLLIEVNVDYGSIERFYS